MALIRTMLLNGIAVGTRMASGLVINKLLAVFVGPAGYAAIGQFQNFIQIVTTVGTGAIGNGVTKYTAEFGDDPERLRDIWKTAGGLVAGLSLVTGAVVAIARGTLSEHLLNDRGLSDVFLWLAIGLVFLSFNSFLTAILNGKKDINRYVASSIAGSVIILASVGGLTWLLGLRGTLIALSIQGGITFFATLWLCRRAGWFRLTWLIGPVQRRYALGFLRFALMAGVSGGTIAGSQMLVRNHLADLFGWTAAGYWDAMARLGSINATLVSTTMVVYFLPRIAETDDRGQIRKEMANAARLILPCFAGVSLLIYFARDLIIPLLFSRTFMPMRDLFAWQLAGDVARAAGWFFAYLFIAKEMMWRYVAAEVIAGVLFVALTFAFSDWLGLEASVVAYFLTYLLMLPILVAMMRFKTGLGR